jgi:hypothetical protein
VAAVPCGTNIGRRSFVPLATLQESSAPRDVCSRPLRLFTPQRPEPHPWAFVFFEHSPLRWRARGN